MLPRDARQRGQDDVAGAGVRAEDEAPGPLGGLVEGELDGPLRSADDEVGEFGGEVGGGVDGDGAEEVFGHISCFVGIAAARRWNQPGEDVLEGRHDVWVSKSRLLYGQCNMV